MSTVKELFTTLVKGLILALVAFVTFIYQIHPSIVVVSILCYTLCFILNNIDLKSNKDTKVMDNITELGKQNALIIHNIDVLNKSTLSLYEALTKVPKK
ncbi:MAG: hypothetical protein GTN36_02735 [Candidatus Aenigmarchaeota archaeon]|nr:hypothetical protein [Candidatus Aenigmarchaeota archaeon]